LFITKDADFRHSLARVFINHSVGMAKLQNHVCDKIFRSKYEIILEKYFNVFEDVFEKSNTL